MASDELREAIGNDPELVERSRELADRIADSERQLGRALEFGDLYAVADALGLSPAELEELGRFYYERAADLAERFPELAEQAARWGEPSA